MGADVRIGASYTTLISCIMVFSLVFPQTLSLLIIQYLDYKTFSIMSFIFGAATIMVNWKAAVSLDHTPIEQFKIYSTSVMFEKDQSSDESSKNASSEDKFNLPIYDPNNSEEKIMNVSELATIGPTVKDAEKVTKT